MLKQDLNWIRRVRVQRVFFSSLCVASDPLQIFHWSICSNGNMFVRERPRRIKGDRTLVFAHAGQSSWKADNPISAAGTCHVWRETLPLCSGEIEWLSAWTQTVFGESWPPLRREFRELPSSVVPLLSPRPLPCVHAHRQPIVITLGACCPRLHVLHDERQARARTGRLARGRRGGGGVQLEDAVEFVTRRPPPGARRWRDWRRMAGIRELAPQSEDGSDSLIHWPPFEASQVWADWGRRTPDTME